VRVLVRSAGGRCLGPIVTEPFVCCLPEHHRLASNEIIDLRKLSQMTSSFSRVRSHLITTT
jgi:hypothetical protein